MKSAIYTVNSSSQTVTSGSTVSLGTVIRRFGSNCQLSGTGITINGTGYYDVTANLIATPSAAGTVTITLYKDGTTVPGAIASETVAATATAVTLPIKALVRETCCCDDSSVLTLVLSGADSVVSNVATVVEKI